MLCKSIIIVDDGRKLGINYCSPFANIIIKGTCLEHNGDDTSGLRRREYNLTVAELDSKSSKSVPKIRRATLCSSSWVCGCVCNVGIFHPPQTTLESRPVKLSTYTTTPSSSAALGVLDFPITVAAEDPQIE